MIDIEQDAINAVQQLIPTLSTSQVQAWMTWTKTRPDYFWVRVGKAVCIIKIYDQIDPPWERVAHEVAWWGHGREAVRALHRGMDWARLQGATRFAYSLAPHLDIIKCRRL